MLTQRPAFETRVVATRATGDQIAPFGSAAAPWLACALASLAMAAWGCAPTPVDAGATGGAATTGGPGSGGRVATGGTTAVGTGGGTGGSVSTATGGVGSGGATNGNPDGGGANDAAGVVDAAASGGRNGGTGTGGADAATGDVNRGGGDARPVVDSPAGDTGVGADAATDSGSSTSALCPANALICDDFEDGNLDGWTKMVNSGTLAIDSAHASSGKNALSINIPANQRGGFLQRKGAPLFPLPNKTMFGRVMVYFDSVSDGHTDFVRGATASGGTPFYNVGEQHGEIMLNYYNGSAYDCWARPSPGKPVPLKAWMCWEWSFDGNTNEIQFWIDSQLSRRVSATGDGCLSGQKSVWTAPDFGALHIGQYIAETRATVAQMWMDDVAVGTQGRIGCPAR